MEELAQKYFDFQNQVGQCDEISDKLINPLFSKVFKRIVNGRTVVSTKADLSLQLTNIRNHFGKWKISPKSVVACADQQQCVVRYIVDLEDMGQFEVMALLKSKTGQQIDEIDEVYYKIS